MTKFRLVLGDAIDHLRSLPSESIDMISTDVAYESLEKHRAVGTTTRLKESDASSNEWFEIFRNEKFPEFFEESHRVLKKNAHLYFFCDEDTSDVAKPAAKSCGFTLRNRLVWAKTKGVVSVENLERPDLRIGMGYGYRRANEFVLYFEKGKRRLNDLSIADVLPFPAVRNGYPTEKPVELLKVLISQSTVPGEIVLDPFVGSGSAGEAAVRLGRLFIGGDLKEKAVEIARRRIAGAGAKEDADILPARDIASEKAPKKRKTALQVAPSPSDVIAAAPPETTNYTPADAPPFLQCPQVCASRPFCRSMGRCLALEPVPDDDLV